VTVFSPEKQVGETRRKKNHRPEIQGWISYVTGSYIVKVHERPVWMVASGLRTFWAWPDKKECNFGL
jgi:hypothetical protein